MQKISLITSLYRSEKHLPAYIQRIKAVLAEATIPLEFMLVVNDATAEEKRLLVDFADEHRVQIIHCERETLYASWNRGIAASTGDFIGFWNVDDSRTLAGLVEGLHLLAEAEIVDFAYEIEEASQIRLQAANFNPPSLNPRDTVSPFFLFRRALYERAGRFTDGFRITGDYEWAARAAVQQAAYCASEVIAGRFLLHDDNLSGGRSSLEWVEFNLALVHHKAYRYLRPVEPELMRQTWESWAKDFAPMPPILADWFWGEGAEKRFRAYQDFRNSRWRRRFHTLLSRLRLASPNPFAPPLVKLEND